MAGEDGEEEQEADAEGYSSSTIVWIYRFFFPSVTGASKVPTATLCFCSARCRAGLCRRV